MVRDANTIERGVTQHDAEQGFDPLLLAQILLNLN